MLQRLWVADLATPTGSPLPAAGRGAGARRHEDRHRLPVLLRRPRRGAVPRRDLAETLIGARPRGQRAGAGRRRRRRCRRTSCRPAGRCRCSTTARSPGCRSGRCPPPGSGAGSRRASSTCCTCTSRSTPSLSLLAAVGADGPIVATFHTAMTRSRALARRAGRAAAGRWRRSPAGSRSASWPARCRSSTSAATRGHPQRRLRRRASRGADAAARLAAAPAARSASSAGSTSRARASPVLLDAFAALVAERPGLRLLVAGRGDADEVLRAACRRRVRDRVDVPRPGRPTRTRPRMLRSVDVYCAPNTGGESFGIDPHRGDGGRHAGRGQRPRRVPPGARRRQGRRAVPDRGRGGAGRRGSAGCSTTRPAGAALAAAAAGSVGRLRLAGRGRAGPARSTRRCIEAAAAGEDAASVRQPRRAGPARTMIDSMRRHVVRRRPSWPSSCWSRRTSPGPRAGSTGCTPGSTRPAPRWTPSSARRAAAGRARAAATRPTGLPLASRGAATVAATRTPGRPRGGRERPDPGAARRARPSRRAATAERGAPLVAEVDEPRAGSRWPGGSTTTWSATRGAVRRRPLVRCSRLAGAHPEPRVFDIDDSPLGAVGRGAADARRPGRAAGAVPTAAWSD